MNRNNSIGSACVSGDGMISYLYDEMATKQRVRFESHLQECSVCTDEFAELSLSRLEVYEWNRDEFAAIPTPVIAIPHETIEHVPWFKSWFGPILSAPKLAAFGTLASVVLAFVLVGSDLSDNSEAVSEVKTIDAPYLIEENSAPSSLAEVRQLAETRSPKSLDTKHDTQSEPKQALKPVASVRKVNPHEPIKATRPGGEAKNMPKAAPPDAPRLTNFEDEADNTLRLADLVADVSPNE